MKQLKVELTDDLYARIMRNSREPYYDVAMVIKNGVPLEPEPKTMIDIERIEKLEKENEIMKKVLIMFISNIRPDGALINFDLENREVLKKLLGQLIL